MVADKVVTPNKTTLRRYLRQKMTQQQMVEAWEAESNIRVSRSAIAMALARHGLKSSTTRARYDDLLPWRVRERHTDAYDAQMLRLEARRRRKGKLLPDQAGRLKAWKDRLEELGGVVHYDAATHEGFWWVPREPIDTDIIRHPDNHPEDKQ